MLISNIMQEGGTLYTWGGMAASGGRGKGARDGHCGCLGVGDTAGRLMPTTCARAGFAALPSAAFYGTPVLRCCGLLIDKMPDSKRRQFLMYSASA